MTTPWKRPGLHNGPPKDKARREKAEVFEVVPIFRGQRELVGFRDMPTNVSKVHYEPREWQARKEILERMRNR
jgi:hypothetical protein